jgi:hypothetical protein
LAILPKIARKRLPQELAVTVGKYKTHADVVFLLWFLVCVYGLTEQIRGSHC